MAAAIAQPRATVALVRSTSSRSRAVILLQVFAVTLFVVPSDAVIKVIGAGGYAAALIGMFAFAAFLTVITARSPQPACNGDTRYVACSACSGCPSSSPMC